MYLFQPFKSFEIGGRDPKPGLYFLTLLPQLEIKAKNMLADSIADEPARTERGQETAGSSRSTIILKPVPIVPNVQSLRSVQVVKTNQDWRG